MLLLWLRTYSWWALPIVDASYIKTERNNWYNIAHLAHKYTVSNPLPKISEFFDVEMKVTLVCLKQGSTCSTNTQYESH